MEQKEVYVDIKWLSASQVAHELKVAYKTVIKLIKDGELTSYRFGRHHKIHPNDLVKYIESAKETNKEASND